MLPKDGKAYQTLKRFAPLRAAIRAVRDALGRYRPMVWQLQGCAHDSAVPLTILYAGQLENKNYIAHLAFVARPTETALGPRWVWRALRASPAGADVRIAELDTGLARILRNRFRFYLPCWIGGEIDLTQAVRHIRRSKNAKEDLRRIRRDGIGYDVARGAAAFAQFYSEMYRPYIETVYGDRAFAMSYDEMIGKLDRSELFLVTRGGEPVAGLIIIYEARGPRAWSLGVKDGDRALVKAGVLRALDYLLVFYLAENGHASVHMGASRPFLKDGVLRHKRRIGLRISDSTARGFALQPTPQSSGARAFLSENPFIFQRDGQYVGAVFAADASLPAERLAQYRRDYGIAGMHRLALFATEDYAEVGSALMAPASVAETPGDAASPAHASAAGRLGV